MTYSDGDKDSNAENPSPTSPDKADKRRGPDPQRLKISYEDWREALSEALEAEHPASGSDAENGEDATP